MSCALALVGLGSAGCEVPTPPVRDAEVEALRNTSAAGLGLGVQAPATLAEPDHVGRCRVDQGGRFRFEREIDDQTLAQQFEAGLLVARTWARDAYPVRVEVRCDPARFELDFEVSWYSPGRRQVLHDPHRRSVVDVRRRRARPEVRLDDLRRALRSSHGVWHERLVVHGA